MKTILEQYNDLKAKRPDCVLLFRVGDFYETYQDDAKVASKLLGITITRSNGSDFYIAPFPFYELDTYLPKLIRAGHRVAICDQLEDPKLKRMVKHGINEMDNPEEGMK